MITSSVLVAFSPFLSVTVYFCCVTGPVKPASGANVACTLLSTRVNVQVP